MEQRRKQGHRSATNLRVFGFETARRGHSRGNPSPPSEPETPEAQIRSVPEQVRHAP